MKINREMNQWYVIEFHSRALPKLLTDLRGKEVGGILPGQCDVIKQALSDIASEANGLPDGCFIKKFVPTYESFRQTYVEWNGEENSTSMKSKLTRKVKISELIETSRLNTERIRSKTRADALEVRDEEVQFIRSAFTHLRKVVDTDPETFAGLKSSVEKLEQTAA